MLWVCVRSSRAPLLCCIVFDEAAAVHEGHQCVQLHALQQGVASSSSLNKLVPDVLRLSYTRILQHNPAAARDTGVLKT